MRHHLHAQFLRERQAFNQDYKNGLAELKKEEQKRSQWRQDIGEFLSETWLARRQQKLSQTNQKKLTKLEKQALKQALKLRDWNDKLEQKFSAEAFLSRLIPYICDFAGLVTTFEHPEMPRTSRSKKERIAAALPERVVAAIVELVLSRPVIEVPPPLGIERDARFSAEQVWELFRLCKEPRLLLSQKIEDRVRSELAEMAEDRRSRELLVDACLTKYRDYAGDGRKRPGITKADIAKAAGMDGKEFGRWLNNSSRIGSERTRRILFVLLSPVWPPVQI